MPALWRGNRAAAFAVRRAHSGRLSRVRPIHQIRAPESTGRRACEIRPLKGHATDAERWRRLAPMIIRFERVVVTKPQIDFNSRRRKGSAGQGSVKLSIPFQILVHAADLQRLAEGGEYAVSFTPMATVIADAEAQGKAT